MMNNPGFYKFPRFTVAVYFTYFESIIVYRSTHRACSLSEKLLLLRLMGVSAASLHIESTDSMILNKLSSNWSMANLISFQMEPPWFLRHWHVHTSARRI